MCPLAMMVVTLFVNNKKWTHAGRLLEATDRRSADVEIEENGMTYLVRATSVEPIRQVREMHLPNRAAEPPSTGTESR